MNYGMSLPNKLYVDSVPPMKNKSPSRNVESVIPE